MESVFLILRDLVPKVFGIVAEFLLPQNHKNTKNILSFIC